MLKFHYIRLIWLLGALLLAVAAPGALALAEPSDADERSFSRAATEMSFGGLDFSLDTLERWSFPLGLRFEWRPAPSRGWTLIPSLNVGYQRATGDRRMRIRQFYGGRQLRVIETTPLDRDFFRLGVGLEARRKNFHAGLGLTSLIGRHQRSISGTFAARWEF